MICIFLKCFHDFLNRIKFLSGRSEANDLAVQMATAYTGNYDVVVFEDGFHGSLGNTRGEKLSLKCVIN
jgi:4-aminobutyrate aminotransferase-like enzyme